MRLDVLSNALLPPLRRYNRQVRHPESLPAYKQSFSFTPVRVVR